MMGPGCAPAGEGKAGIKIAAIARNGVPIAGRPSPNSGMAEPTHTHNARRLAANIVDISSRHC